MPRKRADQQQTRQPVKATLSVEMIHVQMTGSPEAIQQALGAVGEALRGLLGTGSQEEQEKGAQI